MKYIQLHLSRILRKRTYFQIGTGMAQKLSPLHTPKWEKSHVGQYTFRASRKASVLITRIDGRFTVVREIP